MASCSRRYIIVLAGMLWIISTTNINANADKPEFKLQEGSLLIKHGEQKLAVSVNCAEFVLNTVTVGKNVKPSSVKGNIEAGQLVEATFSPISLNDSASFEAKLFLQWSAKESVLRKWVQYRLVGSFDSPVVKEIILERINTQGLKAQMCAGETQSYPAFLEGFFLGIEFPVAGTRLEGEQLILAHHPGLRMEPGVWYESRKAVYGIAPKGKEKKAFQEYIAAHRPQPRGLHFNYNSWWTAPHAYSEQDILDIMKCFDDNLFKPYGVSFDTFCIDDGWPDNKSIWQIDKKNFPDGFTKIEKAAHAMKSNMGLWISPSSCYARALDNNWAMQNGYETFKAERGKSNIRFCCVAGERYNAEFRSRCVTMAKQYGIKHFKFDGFLFHCNEADHGHQPGDLSAEAEAEGMTVIFKELRKAVNDAWFEPTCFGFNPSPWWLFYVNSVIGSYGDDAPYGRVPCPIYRESYTTARDYYNLQSVNSSVPIVAQEVLGIVHQSPDAFLNDAVTTVMRGHAFLPLYINPKYMNQARWKMLADLMKWSRKNFSVLEHTRMILPKSWQNNRQPEFSHDENMPRELYAYSHWENNHGLVEIRNPWIAPAKFSLKLDEAAGLSAQAGGLSVVSIYPQVRIYAQGLRYGDTIEIPAAPYETVVLSIKKDQPVKGLVKASEAICNQIKTKVTKNQLKRIEFSEPNKPGEYIHPQIQLNLDAAVSVDAPEGKLLILLEGYKNVEKPEFAIKINGKESDTEARCSVDYSHPVVQSEDTGWASTGRPVPEHWRFIQAPLACGDSSISVELQTKGEVSKISVWVWATKTGKTESNYPNALPSPELISLDAAPLLPLINTADISDVVRKSRPAGK